MNYLLALSDSKTVNFEILDPKRSQVHTLFSDPQLLYTFLLRSKVPRSNEDSLCIDYH